MIAPANTLTLEDVVDSDGARIVSIPRHQYSYSKMEEVSQFLGEYTTLIFELNGIEDLSFHMFEYEHSHKDPNVNEDLTDSNTKFFADAYILMLRDNNTNSVMIQKHNGKYLLVWNEVKYDPSREKSRGGIVSVTTYSKSHDHLGHPLLEQVGNPEEFEDGKDILAAKAKAAKYMEQLIQYHKAEEGKCDIPFMQRDPNDPRRFFIDHDPNHINYLVDYHDLPKEHLWGFKDAHERTLASLEQLQKIGEIQDSEYRAARTLLAINKHRYEAVDHPILIKEQ
ncbi:hypothetical protein H6503_01360 [Candidatus Woesearchaeota archaeon]|nr:hypothetical protein [Candidatus Woesearchaeota archaeon]